ncbi:MULTISPECIES: hypothetical protein [unclassified Streptomyces]|uniref:hypothetical protein n=1 Tax=unclassified Streptomyces TaxID=2593676 RepID=UPI00382FE779
MPPSLDGFRVALAIAAGAVAIGLVLALFPPSHRPGVASARATPTLIAGSGGFRAGCSMCTAPPSRGRRSP